MDDKQKIIDKVMPRAVLQAMTLEALEAVPQSQRIDEYIVIHRFPFRMGRESRIRRNHGEIERIERSKLAERQPGNDLYLLDQGKLLNISKQHLAIEKTADGYLLEDRGSACGTRVDGGAVTGVEKGGKVPLRDGDVFVLGSSGSPYRYKFIVLAE